MEEQPCGEDRRVETEAARLRLPLEDSSDQPDGFVGAPLVGHYGCQFRKSHRLRDNQPVQRNRRHRKRRAQDQPRQPLQGLLQVCAFEQWHVRGRPKTVDSAMNDSCEQSGLVVEAVIKRALRNLRALGHGLDRRFAVPKREEEFGGRIDNSIAELLRLRR